MSFCIVEKFSFNFRRNIAGLGAILRCNTKEISIYYCLLFQYHATVKYSTENLEKLLRYKRVFNRSLVLINRVRRLGYCTISKEKGSQHIVYMLQLC